MHYNLNLIMPKRRTLIWYHPDLKEQARELRNNCTLSEKLLWQKLKGKQLKGYDFHRQKPLNYYIVDFYCNELGLAIELDGSVHRAEDTIYRDKRRQEALEECGIRFLRFSDEDIYRNIQDVLARISEWVDDFERSTVSEE
jgi:very-short-patch-repair endonuclease